MDMMKTTSRMMMRAVVTLSSSAWSSASVAGLASTMAPPAAAFLVAYSWILDTNNA